MTAHQKQKRKKDPYKTFVWVTVIIAAVAVISLGVFLACNALVDAQFNSVTKAIYDQNEADEQAFNLELSEMRAAASQTTTPGEEVTVELPSWEATLDGTVWKIQDEGTAGLENTKTIVISHSALCEGGLMLVNPWHPVSSYFSDANLVSVGSASGWDIPVSDATVKVFPDAFNALQTMYDDAIAAGMTDYIVREGFRTNERQTELFTGVMEGLEDKYSGNILIEETKKTVNYPGTSEYQSGLSFRLGLYNAKDPAVAAQKFQQTPQGQWVTDNSWKYGIIFRFPSDNYPNSQWEDKSYKTGVSIHLDLYRYVGIPHAVAMKVLGYCLEEYLEFLAAHPHISIYEGDVLRYEIVRINVIDQDAYDLPITQISSSYMASIDNMGGIVLAYTYGF